MKISLKNRIWLLFILTNAAILVIVFFSTYSYFHFQWSNQIKQDLKSEISEIQREGIKKIHSEIEEDEYFFKLDNQDFPTIKENQFIESRIDNHDVIITQFDFEGNSALIGKPVDHYQESQENLFEVFINTAIISLIFVIIIGYIFSRLAIRPIKKLNKEIKSIDFSHIDPNIISVGKNMHDEVIILQQTFKDTLIKLKKYHQEQRQFIDAASHEFRTPLTVIQTCLDLSKKHPEKLEEAKKELKHLTSLTSELLLLTKLENAQPPMQDENISKLINEELKQWKKHPIKGEISPNVVLNTNKELFLTIIRNLLDNAVKFANKKTPIQISLSAKQLKIENSYSKKVDIGKITKAFYQVDPYISDKGVGLGLHLVVKIARVLNLKCEFYSKKGSFEVAINF